MRKLMLSKKERQQLIVTQKAIPDVLEDVVKDHDPERKSFVNTTNGPVHNEEYLISIYMDHIGRPDALPDSWRTPTPYMPGFACKIRKTMPAPAPRPARAERETLYFDPLDTSRMSLAERAETAAERTSCMDITLWKQYSTSTEEEREAHQTTYLRLFKKQSSGMTVFLALAWPDNSNALSVLRAYDAYCRERHGLGIVRPIESLQQYEAFLRWKAAHCSEFKSQDSIMRTTCNHAATLARFHGHISGNFKWGDSSYARNLLSEVTETKLMVAIDTVGKTVNQQNATLGLDQLDRLYKWALTQPACTCALLLSAA